VGASSSIEYLPTKAADTIVMDWRSCVAHWFSKMPDQMSLTLLWCSILQGCSDIDNAIFAHKGSQHFDYSLMSLHISFIIQDATTKSFMLRRRSLFGDSSCGTDLSTVITWVGFALSAAEPHASEYICMWQLDLVRVSAFRSMERFRTPDTVQQVMSLGTSLIWRTRLGFTAS